MAWLILILVLLAAAFGVLGVVLKVTAIIVFTTLLSIVVLATLVWWIFKRQARKFAQEFNQPAGGTPGDGRELPPTHDDRY
jgi:peptidoglycan/LPS O-acetylase OafA/YrhL